MNAVMKAERGGAGKKTNNLNFLINLLDKDFIACYKLKSFNTKEVGDLYIMPFFNENALKTKKEDGMKKLVILVIAVFLALPVLSHAGAVDTKWDMTINGYVASFWQWSDQNDGQNWGPATAAARRTGADENRSDEQGNMAVQIDPRIGFNIKGPDTWGAKTSARLEFDFAGAYANTNGVGRIRHAYMKFDWANDSILFGNGPSPYRNTSVGLPPGVSTSVALPGAFGGPRSTQLMWERRYGKDFVSQFALVHPGQEGYKTTSSPTQYTESNYPNAEALVKYSSDACGKIGNSKLTFALAGVYGRMEIERPMVVINGRDTYSWYQDDGWWAQASFQIPIIPERQNNKAGALLFWMNAAAGQGLPSYGSAPAAVRRSGDDYSKVRAVAYEAALSVWLSNTVWVNGQYNSQDRNFSSRAALNAAETTWKRNQLFNLALFYAPNPAITLTAEIEQAPHELRQSIYHRYKSYKNYGTENAIRVGAYYYF